MTDFCCAGRARFFKARFTAILISGSRRILRPSTPTIFDAYGNYRYEPWAQLRAGKFKTPEGLEQLQEDVNTSFNERSLVTDLVPNRDVGVQLWGDINGGVLSYAAGIFNGVGDAQNSGNAAVENEVEFAGRLFAQPFKNSDFTALQGLGFGVAGTSQNGTSNREGLAINHRRHIARIYDGRTAAVLCLQCHQPSRTANTGGFRRRAIIITGR